MRIQEVINGKEITIIGTAHISSDSVEEVKLALLEIQPDTVAIELDDERYKSMTEKKNWQDMDIVDIIKKKKVGFLVAQMILSSYQRKIAQNLKLNVGEEMSTAIQYSKENHTKLLMIDRNIQTTLLRIWHNLGWFEKVKMLTELLSSMFENDVKEEDIEALKQGDMLQSALTEISKQFPQIAETLIFERDRIMAYKLSHAQGNKIVAVVGAAHLPGIQKNLLNNNSISDLMVVPKKKGGNLTAWIFPLFIVGLIALSIINSPGLAVDTILRFILINGSLAALGTLIALGHPLSILTAFVMAPIGVLSPFLATGWFAGLMEAWIHKPKVEDFMNLQDDVLHIKGYWSNRVARILLVVLLANIFASLGSIVYSIDLIKNLFN
ncbi:MAG: TraB/GumN family protein [Erysipelotrichaceae bacterium]|nr:TraB/GumN family protein [Erysipelotrichaceae bacterium]